MTEILESAGSIKGGGDATGASCVDPKREEKGSTVRNHLVWEERMVPKFLTHVCRFDRDAFDH